MIPLYMTMRTGPDQTADPRVKKRGDMSGDSGVVGGVR
jgi:hypothetical protein